MVSLLRKYPHDFLFININLFKIKSRHTKLSESKKYWLKSKSKTDQCHNG